MQAAPKKPSVRNLGIYEDDFRKWGRAAEGSGRSRARLMRFVLSEWSAGRAVHVPIPARMQFKRQASGGRK